MPDFSFPREERLRSLTTIRRLFTEGKGGFVYPFRYTVLVEKPKQEVGETENLVVDGVTVESAQKQCSGKVEISDLAPTVKRANDLVAECRRQLSITKDELDKIMKADISMYGVGHQQARDIFMVGVWTAQRVSDYNYISKENMKRDKKIAGRESTRPAKRKHTHSKNGICPLKTQ